jgi:hypothetical protein
LDFAASLSMSQLDVGIDTSSSLESVKWLSKLPELLAMQAQEPETKAAPCSSMTVWLKICHRARQGIFDEDPYLARQVSMFYRQAYLGIP